MNFAVIPWQVFLDALQKQQATNLEAWLRRWLFTNEGVLLAHQQTERIKVGNTRRTP